MRLRILAVVLVISIVLVAVWELRRSPPLGTPTVTAPSTQPVPLAPSRSPTPVPEKKRPTLIVSKKNIPKERISEAPPDSRMPTAPQVAAPLTYVPPAPTPAEPKEWTGNNDTSITHSGQIVIQNDSQWVRFWAEHHPHEAAPDVDFSQSTVVGVFLGQRPADGFKVVIPDVRTLPDALVVDYIELAPPPGTFQVAVEVFPYDIKVIPKTALHVKFNELSAQYQKSPPLGSR